MAGKQRSGKSGSARDKNNGSPAPDDYQLHRCSQCNKGCKTPQGLDKHTKYVHSEPSVSQSFCGICQTDFTTKQALIDHLKCHRELRDDPFGNDDFAPHSQDAHDTRIADHLQRSRKFNFAATWTEESSLQIADPSLDCSNRQPVSTLDLPNREVGCPIMGCFWEGSSLTDLCEHAHHHFPDSNFSIQRKMFPDYESMWSYFESKKTVNEPWREEKIGDGIACWRCAYYMDDSYPTAATKCTSFFHHALVNGSYEAIFCFIHMGHNRPVLLSEGGGVFEPGELDIPDEPSIPLRVRQNFDTVLADVFKHGIQLSLNRSDPFTFEKYIFTISKISGIDNGPPIPRELSSLKRCDIMYERFVLLMSRIRENACSNMQTKEELNMMKEILMGQVAGFPVKRVVLKRKHEEKVPETRKVLLNVKIETPDHTEDDGEEDEEEEPIHHITVDEDEPNLP